MLSRAWRPPRVLCVVTLGCEVQWPTPPGQMETTPLDGLRVTAQ